MERLQGRWFQVIKVVECLNPVPQGGGPKVMFTLWDPEKGWNVSRTGKPVSGHGAPLFTDRVSAEIIAEELNGPEGFTSEREDWEMNR